MSKRNVQISFGVSTRTRKLGVFILCSGKCGQQEHVRKSYTKRPKVSTEMLTACGVDDSPNWTYILGLTFSCHAAEHTAAAQAATTSSCTFMSVPTKTTHTCLNLGSAITTLLVYSCSFTAARNGKSSSAARHRSRRGCRRGGGETAPGSRTFLASGQSLPATSASPSDSASGPPDERRRLWLSVCVSVAVAVVVRKSIRRGRARRGRLTSTAMLRRDATAS